MSRLISVAAKMEDQPTHIRVRYCGGCNPEIDRGAVVSRLREIMRSTGTQAVPSSDGEADWLLLVNGCPRACLEEEYAEAAGLPRCISVEGAHVDHRPVAEEELAEIIWETIASSHTYSAVVHTSSRK